LEFKEELKKSLRELHRMNIMISSDLSFYIKEVDNFFNSLPNVEANEPGIREGFWLLIELSFNV
jgi:hypothetical protein